MFDQSDHSHPQSADNASSAITQRRADHALGRHDSSAHFPPDSHEGAKALRETIALLMRAKWLILGIFAGISVIALPVIWTFVQPKYRATAQLRVAPQNMTILFNVEDQGMNQFYPLYVATQIATITNGTVLQSALERSDVQATEWINKEPRSLKTMLGSAAPNDLERLKAAIEVEQEGDTDILSINVTTTTAEDTHILANAVLEEYMKYIEDESDELEALRFDTLREEHKIAVSEIEKLVERRGELSKELGTDDPDIVRAQLAEQIGELEMERKQLFRQCEMMRWSLLGHDPKDLQEHGIDTELLAGGGGAAQYAADAEWQRLNGKVLDVEQQIEEAGTHYGPEHPRMKVLRARLANSQRELSEREAALGPDFQAATGVIASTPRSQSDGQSTWFIPKDTLKIQLARMEKELAVLDTEIKKVKDEQQSKGELAKQVAQISDKLSRKQEMENALHDRIQALETEEKAPGRITVQSPALKVSEAYKDKRLLLSVMAMGGAFFCGVVVAQLRVSVNPKVFVVDDVQSTARVPFLGQIPQSPTSGTLLNDPNLLVQECMRMVRTALLERLADARQRAVMITSASSSAGKTTVAIELSKSLAHLGKRTLLVEADLRRPTLAKRLGLDNENGLCALLEGEIEMGDAITPSGVRNLDVIFAGRRPPVLNPEVLANGVFTASLRQWKKDYDFVLLDCPPILPVADARILARQVDGAIMVSRSSHCRRTDVIQACADLSAAGGPLLGSVLVGVQPGSGYGYQYEYSYESTA